MLNRLFRLETSMKTQLVTAIAALAIASTGTLPARAADAPKLPASAQTKATESGAKFDAAKFFAGN
jgi:hypothetical protein